MANLSVDFNLASLLSPEALEAFKDASILSAYAERLQQESDKRSKAKQSTASPKGKKAPKLGEEKRQDSRKVTYIVAPPLTLTPYKVDRENKVRLAHSFLEAYAQAGYRFRENEAGAQIKVYDGRLAMVDQKTAVTSFVGWTDEAHGIQLDRACLHARWLTRHDFCDDYEYRSHTAHHARLSIAGYVSGLPNHLNKVLGDLTARERVASEEYSILRNLAELTACINDPETSEQTRKAQLLEYERFLLKLEVWEREQSLPIKVKEGNRVREVSPDPKLAKILRSKPEFLPKMLAFAFERINSIRRDLDGVSFENPDIQAVEKASSVINSRGEPLLSERIALFGEIAKN